MNRKYLLFIIGSFFLLMAFKTSEIEKEEEVNAKVIYPKIRIWTTPSNGEEAKFNSPSLQWPSDKKAKYSVRLSSSKDFSSNLIEKEAIPFAIFNPHKILDEGK